MNNNKLELTSSAFNEGDWIPIEYSARGKDISPELRLGNISKDAICIAITLDDASHPLFPNYNHWVIWDIPVQDIIPANIAHGEYVEDLGGAVQGVAYGKNRYKGPKPPFKRIHSYVFTVYILDCKCELSPKSTKSHLMSKIEGHILQKATLTGKFQSHRK